MRRSRLCGEEVMPKSAWSAADLLSALCLWLSTTQTTLLRKPLIYLSLTRLNVTTKATLYCH